MLPRKLLAFAKELRTPTNQTGFLLSCVYFKAAKRFFSPDNFHSRDIDYAINKLSLEEHDFRVDEYTRNTRLRHEHFILEYYGFKRLDEDAKRALETEIASMTRTQLKPKLIFARCLDFLVQNKVQLPSVRRLSDMITASLQERRHALAKIIDKTLPADTRELLDQLFDVDSDEEKSTNARYKLTLLKKLSHSMKPTKVKERTADLQLLEGLYTLLMPALSSLNLGAEGIRYYAGTVIKSEIFQISRRADEDRYVHLIAFVAHQYYRLQDNLVEVLLSSVKNAQNSAQKEQIDQRGKLKSRAGFAKVLVAKETKANAQQLVDSGIRKGAMVNTDGSPSLRHLERVDVDYQVVSGDPAACDRWLPWVHRFISNAKTWVNGTHHGIKYKHLSRYLAEYTYRFNRRHDVSRLFHRALVACATAKPVRVYALR